MKPYYLGIATAISCFLINCEQSNAAEMVYGQPDFYLDTFSEQAASELLISWVNNGALDALVSTYKDAINNFSSKNGWVSGDIIDGHTTQIWVTNFYSIPGVKNWYESSSGMQADATAGSWPKYGSAGSGRTMSGVSIGLPLVSDNWGKAYDNMDSIDFGLWSQGQWIWDKISNVVSITFRIGAEIRLTDAQGLCFRSAENEACAEYNHNISLTYNYIFKNIDLGTRETSFVVQTPSVPGPIAGAGLPVLCAVAVHFLNRRKKEAILRKS